MLPADMCNGSDAHDCWQSSSFAADFSGLILYVAHHICTVEQVTSDGGPVCCARPIGERCETLYPSQKETLHASESVLVACVYLQANEMAPDRLSEVECMMPRTWIYNWVQSP